MTEIVTAARMRAIEAGAIEGGTVTGIELMERAGAAAVAAILDEWPELGPRAGVTVLCGPGGNGGDGFVIARLLRERGLRVRVLAVPAARRGPDAAEARRRWRLAGGRAAPLSEASLGPVGGPEPGPHGALYVDAVLGTGARGPLDGPAGRAVAALGGHMAGGFGVRDRLVAIDLPSGLDSDSGRVPGHEPPRHDPHWSPVPAARLTVTFDSPKLGHVLGLGPALCGRVVVADIGLAAARAHAPLPGAEVEPLRRVALLSFGGARPAAARISPIDRVPDPRRGRHGLHLPPLVPDRLPPKAGGHKFDHGHALVLAGGVGRGGAARLAARAALRVGAGLVTVAPPPAALIENAARLDAIMLRAVRDAEALGVLLEDGRLNALCLGPGLGTGEREAGLVRAALGGAASASRATVLDGDALTLIAADPELFGALDERSVLTPHAGEFARLFPDIAGWLATPADAGPAYSKLDAAREAAARAGCTIVLKGPDTVIAGPDGRAAIHAAAYGRAAPWLATAGAGDVLAGIVTGLLARGHGPFDAACAAAWLHVECALAFGPGLIAEDLPEMLPRVLARLEGGTPPG